VRRWDSCQLSTFTVVATGENFRKERESRVRHRMYRKYYWLAQRFGETFCVGCGRCGRYCVANIHPYDIATKLQSRYCLTLADAVLGK
ncbi:MAG: 4Fe-4S ferredoxin, partial [Planctomycetota bacterium]